MRQASTGLVAVLVALVATASQPFPSGVGPGGTRVVPGMPGAGSTVMAKAVNNGDPVTPPSPTADPVVPPPGALPADDAVDRLAARGAVIDLDETRRLVTVTAAPTTTLSDAPGDEAFVRQYAAAFGVPNGSTVRRVDSAALVDGATVRYQQEFGGVPVLGGELRVTVDGRGQVVAATAETVSVVPTTTNATVAAESATATALSAVAARTGLDVAQLRASAKLWLYDPRVIGAPGRTQLRPTWWVSVRGVDGDAVGSVLVDGLDGSEALVISEQRSADRIVCDLNNTRVNFNDLNAYACNSFSAGGRAATTRSEGGPASSVAEVNRAYDYLGATENFYATNFGRDSFDGHGGQARASVRACSTNPLLGTVPCPYPNAFWNDYQLVFGDGFVTDDVVAHEFTHAVTTFSSNLFYAYQSGAINEALSDIMGEFVDQSYNPVGEDTSKLWLVGEDLPPDPGTGIRELRDMANPMRLGQPNYVHGQLWSQYDRSSPLWDNGGVHTNSGPANYAAYLIAVGGTPNGTPITGLGLAKSRQLWYRVMHQLTSGANYDSLGRALTSACLQLVGHGFNRGDCADIGQVRAAVGMGGLDDCYFHGGVVGTPRQFSDDFEGTNAWTLTSPVWQMIPSADVPVRYAHSGTHALYGYVTSGQVGYAELPGVTLTLPTTSQAGPYLYIFASVAKLSDNQGYVQVELNDGTGWKTAALLSGNFSAAEYEETSGPVWAQVSGTAVHVRFKLIGDVGYPQEFLIDDVSFGLCGAEPGLLPRLTTAGIVGTTGTITWDAATQPNAHFQLTYDPPIPGAPTTVPAANGSNTYSVTIPNLDPDRVYHVLVSGVDDRPGGLATQPVTITMRRDLPPNCPLRPLTFLTIWTPRTTPSTDGCELATPPRRSG